MTEVAYPEVQAALLATLEAAFATSIRVVDGYDLSEDGSDVIMLGVPNLTDLSSISAGRFDQEQMGYGAAGVIQETGTINGIAVAWNGDSNSVLARTTAVGYVASIGAAIRAARSLGVTAFDLVAQLSTGDIAEDKEDGATCAVSFTVNYIAQIQP